VAQLIYIDLKDCLLLLLSLLTVFLNLNLPLLFGLRSFCCFFYRIFEVVSLIKLITVPASAVAILPILLSLHHGGFGGPQLECQVGDI
jgi:hypothetical protein